MIDHGQSMVMTWGKMVKPHGWDESQIYGIKWYSPMAGRKAWSIHGVKWYTGMQSTVMVNSWSWHGVKWYKPMAGMKAWSIHSQGMG